MFDSLFLENNENLKNAIADIHSILSNSRTTHQLNRVQREKLNSCINTIIFYAKTHRLDTKLQASICTLESLLKNIK